MTAARQKIYYFDWIKVILAYVGIFYHSWRLLTPDFYDDGPNLFSKYGLIDYFMWCLHSFRMQTFFLVSGFLFYLNMDKSDSLGYFKKVISRLVTYVVFIYLVCVPVVLYLNFWFKKYNMFFSLESFIRNYVTSLGTATVLNLRWSYGWFMYYLLLITLIAGLIYFALRKWRFPEKWDNYLQTSIGSAGVFALVYYFNWNININGENWSDIGSPFNSKPLAIEWSSFFYYLVFFMVGMICSRYRKFLEYAKSQAFLTALLSLGVFILIYILAYYYLIFTSEIWIFSLATFVSIMTPFALIGLAQRLLDWPAEFIQKQAQTKVLVFVFLAQNPLIYLIYILLKPLNWDKAAMFTVVGVFVSLILSLIGRRISLTSHNR